MRGPFFTGILTTMLRAKVLRARIAGWPDADVIVRITLKGPYSGNVLAG